MRIFLAGATGVIGAVAALAFVVGVVASANRWMGEPLAALAIVVGGAAPLLGLSGFGRLRPRLATVTCFGAGLAGLLVAIGVRQCQIQGCPVRSSPDEESWRDVQRWTRANTPAGTVLLTPLKRNGFSLFSRRATWVDWKAGSVVVLDPSLYPTWQRRYEEVSELKNTRQLVAYARAHQLRYVVVDLERQGLPAMGEGVVRYSNHRFAVIDTH